MWPCEARRRAREAQLDRELEERLRRPSQRLAAAAVAPEPPLPSLWFRLPLEGSPDVWYSGAPADASRLIDWASRGAYRVAVEEFAIAMTRDRGLPE